MTALGEGTAKGRTARLPQELLRSTRATGLGTWRPLAGFLRGRFEPLGAEVDVIKAPVDEGTTHTRARLRGGGSKHSLLLEAHSDVVPVARECWRVDPLGGSERDDAYRRTIQGIRPAPTPVPWEVQRA